MFRAWGAGHGPPCLTGLMAQRGPVSGHKKTPANEIPAGALSALWGLYSSLKKSIVMRPGG
jgi:hypothetical protein